MGRKLRILMLLMLALAVALPAYADELPGTARSLLPADAEIQASEIGQSMISVQAVIPHTGEVLLVSGTGGGVLFAQTIQEASCGANAPAVERSRAEEIVKAAYPGCRILFARDTDSVKCLGVASEGFCGTIVVADDRIRSRSLQSGEIFRDGRLTMDGALKVLAMHRPEAQFRALELDEDDGIYVYEGEALISGEEYEFELDVSTGRLLEWERD